MFRLNSTLVFLDVTVLNKSCRPVVTGLTKDDFTILEDKKPQRIFSFEAPQTHRMGPNAGDENPDGKAPVTIFVLDLLNSNFEDFAYIRYEVKRFLSAQPEPLASPAELMVIGNESLEMLVEYTRSRSDLMNALEHLPAALPYKKMMNGSFFWERFAQSMDALQQIACSTTVKLPANTKPGTWAFKLKAASAANWQSLTSGQLADVILQIDYSIP